MKRAVPVIPYGYRLSGGALVPDPREQEAVCIIRDEWARGTSFVRLARLLAKRGYTTRTGKPFMVSLAWEVAKGLEAVGAVVSLPGL